MAMSADELADRRTHRKVEAARDRIDGGGCAIALILGTGFIAHIGHAVLEAVKALT